MQEHFAKVQQGLHQLMLAGTFCDLTLQVGHETFTVHKCIMAAASQYFWAMLGGNFKESHTQFIRLHSLNAVIFRDIIQFAYTGRVIIKVQNCTMLYEAAAYLQFQLLTEMVEEFMIKHVCEETVIRFTEFAKIYPQLNKLYQVSKDYMLANFEKVAGTGTFQNLSYIELLHVVQDDRLMCDSELVIAQVLCTWMSQKTDLDSKHKYSLFENLRYLPSEELQTFCTTFESVLEPEILQFLSQRQVESILPPRGECSIITTGCIDNDVIVGQSLSSDKGMTLMNPLHKSYFVSGELVVLHHAGTLFFIGGGENQDDLYSFHLMSRTWLELSKMSHSRIGHNAAVCDEHILVFGGFYDAEAVTGAESYDIVLDRWTDMTPYPQAIHSSACCKVNGKVFVSGGCLKFDRAIGDIYSYKQDQWHKCGKLSVPRYSHCMDSDNSTVYILGGYSNTHASISGVEVLELDEYGNLIQSSQCVLNLPEPCRALTFTPFELYAKACFIHEGKLCVVGSNSSVWTFKNQWKELSVELCKGLALECVVVANIPHHLLRNGPDFSNISDTDMLMLDWIDDV